MGTTGPVRALILLAACQGRPATFAECARLDDATAREQCRYDFAVPMLDDAAAFDAALASVDDPSSRDLLLRRLAITAPTRAGLLCEKVQTAPAVEKCRQVLGRPHLQSTPREPRSEPQSEPQAP